MAGSSCAAELFGLLWSCATLGQRTLTGPRPNHLLHCIANTHAGPGLHALWEAVASPVPLAALHFEHVAKAGALQRLCRLHHGAQMPRLICGGEEQWQQKIRAH